MEGGEREGEKGRGTNQESKRKKIVRVQQPEEGQGYERLLLVKRSLELSVERVLADDDAVLARGHDPSLSDDVPDRELVLREVHGDAGRLSRVEGDALEASEDLGLWRA